MALLTTVAYLGVVVSLCLLAIAFGARVLLMFRLRLVNPLEHTLFAAGISFGLLQIVILALTAAGLLRREVFLIVLAVMALAAGRSWLFVAELGSSAALFVAHARKSKRALACISAILVLLTLDALIAMAPLTGSDALHYHFTVPAFWLHNGFAPMYGTTLSFAVGQSHMLILLGLALGSDHIALGLIYLGGVPTAGTIYVLAREWMSFEMSLLATLSFLLSPIIFWQMTVAGAPDIWMVFFTTLAVLAAARCIQIRSVRLAVLVGFFAGAAAGSKFTAWPIPAVLALVLLAETRSLWPSVASVGAALLSGTGSLIRNFIWTGDPFFPFLTRSLTPHNVNAYTLAAVLADTRPAGGHGGMMTWAEYPFLLVLQGQNYGFGHYFGPLILTFAPLLILAYKPTPLFRTAAFVWAGMFISSVDPPQMARFLLPVFAIALAMAFAGADAAYRMRRPLLRMACSASIAVFLLFGTVSYGAYASNFLRASIGLESREHFLARSAPNYQEVAFINQSLEGQPGTALVFLRYVYYLRVNYVQGDPQFSWEANPGQLQTSRAMLEWLRNSGVRWIVKIGEYPAPLRKPLEELQAQGMFQPVASVQTEDFTGFRLENNKTLVNVTIFELQSGKP